MKNIYTYDKEKGFTLVELLAVIVILAIIMIIAIPTVLTTMQSAKRKTFIEFIDKSVLGAQRKLSEDELQGASTSGCVIYNIKNDLEFSSTGDFDGYVLIDSKNSQIYVSLHDSENYVSVLRYGENVDDKVLRYSDSDDINKLLSDNYLCENVNGCSVCKVKDPESGEITEKEETKKDGGLLLPGIAFNEALKNLSNNKTDSDHRSSDRVVKEIRYSSIPDTSGVVVSASDSSYPIYASFDSSSGIMTLSSEKDKIYINPNAHFCFAGFLKTTFIDFDHIDCSKVINASQMFASMQSLPSLDLNILKDAKITDISGTFQYMSSLTSLDLSPLDTSRVTNMSASFCRLKLNSIDFSTLNTSKVTDMSYMFYESPNFTSLDLSSFVTTNTINMASMFCGCEKLETLNLSSFDFSKVEDASMMFTYCMKLTSFGIDTFNFENVKDLYATFADCNKINKINLSGFTNRNEVDMKNTFGACNAVTEINISGFVNPKFDDSFIYCKSVNVIYVNSEYSGSLTFNNTKCKINTLTKI